MSEPAPAQKIPLGELLTFISQEGDEHTIHSGKIMAVNEEGKAYPWSSEFIVSMLGTDSDLTDPDISRIPMPRLSNRTLSLVLAFCEDRYTNGRGPEMVRPLELMSKPFLEYIRPTDTRFTSDLTLPELCYLIDAANFLGIADLTSLTHCYMISLLKNRTKEEVIKIFEPCSGLQRHGCTSESSGPSPFGEMLGESEETC